MPSGPPPHKPLTQTHWPPFVGHHDVASTPSDETRVTQDDTPPPPRGGRWKPHQGGYPCWLPSLRFLFSTWGGKHCFHCSFSISYQEPTSSSLILNRDHSPLVTDRGHGNRKSGAASPHLSLSVCTSLSSTETECLTHRHYLPSGDSTIPLTQAWEGSHNPREHIALDVAPIKFSPLPHSAIQQH